MTGLIQAIGLENKKMRGRGVWIIWALLTLALTGWLTYSMTGKGGSDTAVMVFENETTRYYAEQLSIPMLFGLFMPVMSAVLIARITEVEHAGDTWKMLRGAGESAGTLWDAKFFIVYSLMELTTILVYAAVFSLAKMQIGGSFPWVPIAKNMVFISLVNFIVLLLFASVSFFYKNQIITLSLGLLGGLAGLMSSLLPKIFTYIIPTGYYMCCALCGIGGGEFNEAGKRVWHYYNVTPSYGFIAAAFAAALILYAVVRKRLNDKEF